MILGKVSLAIRSRTVNVLREDRDQFVGTIKSLEADQANHAVGTFEDQDGEVVHFEIMGSKTPHVIERAQRAYANDERIAISGITLYRGTSRCAERIDTLQVAFEHVVYIEIDRIIGVPR